METQEQRSAAWEGELRDKYTQADRNRMAKSGEAMSDGAYPIADAEDLKNAISTVGLGDASKGAIKAHIMGRAKALGMTAKLPDAWMAGTRSEDDATEACPTCGGEGKIMDGNRDCPDCDGTGERPKVESRATPLARRKRDRHRTVPLYPEVRHFPASGLEIRAVADSDHEVVITGTPIVYDTPYVVVDPLGEFEERMSRGVARDVINNRMDVRFLFNHKDMPMARTASGTMTLRDSPEALRFEARLDTRQQAANDLVIAIQRGDVSQMSCGFIPAKDEWNASMTKRNVVLFRDLPDISAVTYPCSPTTSIDIARRMAMEIPVESHARLRQLFVETRAGKVLSAERIGQVTSAVKTLHEVLGAAGVDPSSLIDEKPEDATEPDEQELPDVDSPEAMPSDEAAVNSTLSTDGTEGGNGGAAGVVADAAASNIRSDPGDDPMSFRRKNLRSLRLEMETRKHRRVA